jgi:hypothetical protein
MITFLTVYILPGLTYPSTDTLDPAQLDPILLDLSQLDSGMRPLQIGPLAKCITHAICCTRRALNGWTFA